MRFMRHWQDPLVALIGFGLVASPWAAGYEGVAVASIGAIVVGAILALAGLTASFAPRPWQAWVDVASAAWLLASPWLLGFSWRADAAFIAEAGGLLVTLLSLSVLLQDGDDGRLGARLPQH